MPRYLHLLKSDSGQLAAPVIESIGREPDSSVTVVLLDDAPPPPLPHTARLLRLGDAPLDYSGLLDLIFEADRVIVW
ncbi:MAG: hypothetical protein HYV93_17205 [Candidatus Rokubacteria bacterium]|nr:hypothetical protein [Candidatus Rokubacteria bacterium]